CFVFFFQAEDGIRDFHVTGVQTCALPISSSSPVAKRTGEGDHATHGGGGGHKRDAGTSRVTKCFTASPLQTQVFHGLFPRLIPTLWSSGNMHLPSPNRGSPTKWRRRRRAEGGRAFRGSALGSPWVK